MIPKFLDQQVWANSIDPDQIRLGLLCVLLLAVKLMAIMVAWVHTVTILSFRTDMPGQTVQTQIRLLLEEQSDQGLHCLSFHLHRLDPLLCGRAT